MQFIAPKFVLDKIELPIKVMHSYDQYFWIDSVERLKGILLEQQLPFIVLKDATQRCYVYNMGKCTMVLRQLRNSWTNSSKSKENCIVKCNYSRSFFRL